ncbi:Dynamin [Carnobacterium sp. AT7]|uniref:dynamin family protein n=1 Tax=Carnobacterium sp. AT7 TaxID=333990 RepID=UPI00015F1AF1|nr:dynamin family protein [Carnobacterium sp. AT7]EDP68711.1 Dynamin [Carnobacterium sp. AT7]
MNNNSFDLKNFRTTIGWTQKKLADKLGIGQSTITSWESNSGNIPFNSMLEIANVTGYKLADLLSYGEKQSFQIVDFSISEESAEKRNEIAGKLSFLSSKMQEWKIESSDYPEYKKAINGLEKICQAVTIENRKLNVAFLGKSDAGKSTMINALLGMEVSPSQWQPATSAVIKIVHIEDKPKCIADNNTIIVRTKKDEGFISADRLYDQDFAEKHIIDQGNYSLISEYGLHNSDDEIAGIDENTMDTIFTYVDTPLLKAINIIDTPGIATGEHTKGKKDTKASENTRSEADAVVYLSVSNQFLQGEDQVYLKSILDVLPPTGDIMNNKPFSNLFIVASQAHITGKLELEKVDGIYDKVVNNFASVLPNNYLEAKGNSYNKATLRSRFFSFSRDDQNITQSFRDDFISFISLYTEENPLILKKHYTKLFNEFIQDQDKVALTLLQEADDLSYVSAEVEKMKSERAIKYQEFESFVQEVQQQTLLYSLNSKEEFSKDYQSVINVDYITHLIDERGFKNRKNDKEAIQNLVSNTLNQKAQSINEKYSNKFAKFLEGKIKMCKKSFDFKHFNFERSFISILAGGAAGGALVFYMSTLGNLGGYILVTQLVGILSSLGISVGGGAVATIFISSIGGPIVLAYSLAILSAAAVFAVTGVGWKKSFAKKLVRSYEKNNVNNQVNESIADYWKDTQDALTQTGEKMKEDYDNSIKELEKKLTQSPQYFFQSAEKVRQITIEVKKWAKHFLELEV